MVDAGAERLVDDELQGRRVTDRQQLLGDCLGRREEPGPHPGGGDHGAADLHGPHGSVHPSMPTYVYRFVDSGETIEVQQSFDDDALTEATHPTTGVVMPVKKVFTPVGVTFKGGGFYKTDSRGRSSRDVVGGTEERAARRASESTSSSSSSRLVVEQRIDDEGDVERDRVASARPTSPGTPRKIRRIPMNLVARGRYVLARRPWLYWASSSLSPSPPASSSLTPSPGSTTPAARGA